jgi:hypothetical protein
VGDSQRKVMIGKVPDHSLLNRSEITVKKSNSFIALNTS